MKDKERAEARALRSQGYTIPEIEEIVNCPRSSISLWTRDVRLSEEAVSRLQKRKEEKQEHCIIEKSILEDLISQGCSLRELARRTEKSTYICRQSLVKHNLKIDSIKETKTKARGDEGVGFIIADLMSHDIQVALPISEHLPFDLIAIKDNKKMIRVSVKYRKATEGKIALALQSSWHEATGTKWKNSDKQAFDVTAIYCPDTRQCYYVRNDEIEKDCCHLSLRILDPTNGQTENIRYAIDYIGANRMF